MRYASGTCYDPCPVRSRRLRGTFGSGTALYVYPTDALATQPALSRGPQCVYQDARGPGPLRLVADSVQQDPPRAAPPPPAPEDGFSTFNTAASFWNNYRDAASPEAVSTRGNAAPDTSTGATAPPVTRDVVYHSARATRPPPQAPTVLIAPPPPRRAGVAPPAVRDALPPAVSPAGGASTAESQWLALHNKYRALHHAPPLTWDARLASGAVEWARRCQFQHSSPGGAYGENLYASSNVPDPVADSVTQWYNEQSSYDFSAGGFSEATGHFTQVVWRSSTALGCGMAAGCAAGDGMDVLVVCRYTPPGNVIGEFRQNVLPQ